MILKFFYYFIMLNLKFMTSNCLLPYENCQPKELINIFDIKESKNSELICKNCNDSCQSC